MNFGHQRAAQLRAGKAGQGFVADNQRAARGVDGHGIGHQIVKIGGHHHTMVSFIQNFGQDGIADAGGGVFHGVFQRGIARGVIPGKTALKDGCVMTGGILIGGLGVLMCDECRVF